MKTTKLLICAVAVAAACAAVKAQGQTLSATLAGINPGAPVTGTFNDGGFVQAYPSGVLDFTEFNAFCVEPLEQLGYNDTVVYQVQDSGTLTNYNTISRLVGGYLSSARTGLDAAAVQWAIWEVTAESVFGFSLFDGNVRITAPANQDVATLANQYITNAHTYTPVNLVYLTSDTHQDVISWNVVPEPSSLGLAALSGFFLLRRRRR